MSDIAWDKIATHSAWLLGLGLMLAAVSFWDYRRREERVPWHRAWRQLGRSGWLHLGGLLFCAGMALTGASWPEQGLWGLLGLYLAYNWWDVRYTARSRRRRRLPSEPALDTDSSLGTHIPRLARPNIAKTVTEWIVRTELLWLALLSPFFLFLAPSRVLPLLALPALWVARRVARGRFLPRTPFDWPIALLMVMVLVSLYATFDVAMSLERIAYILFGVGVFYALMEWASNGTRLRWAAGAFVLAGVGLAIIGLLGSQWIDKLPVVGQISTRLPAVLRGIPGEEGGFNPTIAGGSLLWVLPLQMALFGWSLRRGFRVSWGRWWLRLGLLAAIGLSTGMLLLAQSRSALVGLLLGMVLLLLMAGSRAAPVLIVALIAGVAATIYVGPDKVADSLFVIKDNTEGGLYSVKIRGEVWSHALYGIEDFPFTGMGMGTFKEMLPLLYPISYAENKITHAHNMFLQAAIDLGLPGLVAYLAMWMVAATLAAQAWRRSPDSWSRAATAGVGACLLASFVLGMTDVGMMVPKTGFLFWGLLGLLVALWKRSPRLVVPPAKQAGSSVSIEAEAEAAVGGEVDSAKPQSVDEKELVSA